MQNSKPINRRNFVKFTSAVIASSPLLTINTSSAQDLTELTENDPTANALGYKKDSKAVDPATYPNHVATQLCSNCSLYQGAAGGATGPCAIFPGKSVSAAGWCSVYAPMPA